MASEKIDVSVSDASTAGIQEFMEGSRHMQGGRHDMAQRGITSSAGEPFSNARASLGTQPEPLGEPNFVQQDNATPQSNDVEHWKKLYGNSENEKGEWRRIAQETVDQLSSIKREFEAMQIAGASTGGIPQGYAQQYAPQPTYTPPHTPQRYLHDKAEEDFVQASELEGILNQHVAPAVQFLAQQQAILAQQQYQFQKTMSGITPQVEQELLSRHTWLRNIPEGPNKLQAMATLVREASTANSNGNGTSVPARNEPNSPQQAARRTTFVESNTPSTSGNELSPDQLFARDMQEAMKKPWGGERRKALEDLAVKYGIGHVNDWGPEMLGMKR